jgi:hypothetical protein
MVSNTTDMFIVLDTNVWLQEFGLNSALGSVTRFYVSRPARGECQPS